MRFPTCALASLSLALAVTVSPANALNIVGKYIAPGDSFSGTFGGGTGGAVAPGTTGDSSDAGIEAVFDAAAEWWEMAIGDEHTITIEYGWDSIDSIATASSGPTAPQPQAYARILVDNDGGDDPMSPRDFFADETPHMNEEWSSGLIETFADLDPGPGDITVNVGREYKSPTAAAIASYDLDEKIDLLTVFKHEIGHALGMNDLGGDFGTITAPRPFPGATIPKADATHIDLPSSLLYTSPTVGERKVQSEVDILAVAQASGWELVSLDPEVSGFDPTPDHSITGITATPLGGEWELPTVDYLGFAHHALPTLVLGEEATDLMEFAVEIEVSMAEPGGSAVMAIDKIVKNASGAPWIGFELILGVIDPASGELMLSGPDDGVKFLPTPFPSEETGHLKEFGFDDPDDANIIFYDIGPDGFPVLPEDEPMMFPGDDVFFWLGLEVDDMVDGMIDGKASFVLLQVPISPIPEPAGIALICLGGLLGCAFKHSRP